MTTKRRTEIISLWVTPEIKKEVEKFKDEDDSKEEIIRRFIKSEVDWLEGEMKEVDEATIRYKARLIAIKDNFEKAQSMHIEQTEQIAQKMYDAIYKLNQMAETTSTKVNGVHEQIREVSKAMEHVSTYNLEKLLDAVERYEKMTDGQKELIKMLINKQA